MKAKSLTKQMQEVTPSSTEKLFNLDKDAFEAKIAEDLDTLESGAFLERYVIYFGEWEDDPLVMFWGKVKNVAGRIGGFYYMEDNLYDCYLMFQHEMIGESEKSYPPF